MRPVTLQQAALGFTQWIPTNRLQWYTNVGIAVSISSGASLTYTVQYTMDDFSQKYQNFTISRTTTVATVTQTNHGLSVGDWISVTNAPVPLQGFFEVASVVDANNFTYTVSNSGAVAALGTSVLQKARVFSHATLAAQIASAAGTMFFPVMAIRLKNTVYASGFADIVLLQGN